MNYSQFSNVVDPRYSSSSSNSVPPQRQFTQSTSQIIPNSNNHSQFAQQPVQQPVAQTNTFVTSVIYQQPQQSQFYTSSYNVGNTNPSYNIGATGNAGSSNIDDVIESVKRSAAIRQSQQQQQPQVIEPQKFTNSTLINSQYVPYDSNLTTSFNPNQVSSTLQQPQQYTNYLSQSQSGVVNSSNLSVPNYSGLAYYQTPDRSVLQKQDASIKFLSPNKSPSSCKIISRSPTKQQIEREVEIQNQMAMQEHIANQNSINNLQNTIDFINANNGSPEKRHTAKSIINLMGGPNQL